jgi:hypothetical protein
VNSEGDSLALEIFQFLAGVAAAAVLIVALVPSVREEARNLFMHTRDAMEHPGR